MRLTKRQLKQIIREEYSNLHRTGLLREFGPASAEDLADFEYEKSGTAKNHSSEIQAAVSETKAFIQSRLARNIEFIEFMLNDFFMRLSQGADGEFLEDDEEWGKIYYAGRVLEDTKTPFKLTEVDHFLTRHLEKAIQNHGFGCNWGYSWD